MSATEVIHARMTLILSGLYADITCIQESKIQEKTDLQQTGMGALPQARPACKTAYQLQQPAQNNAQRMQRDKSSTMDSIISQKFAMSGYLLVLEAAFNLRPSLLVRA